MGFLANMLSGGAGIAGANNAHLAELLIPALSQSERKMLAARIVDITRRSGFPNMTDAQAHNMFNSKERLAQLNLLALAFNEMGFPSPVPGETWMPVARPLMPSTDAKDLETNAGHFRRKYGKIVSVGSRSIDILTWA